MWIYDNAPRTNTAVSKQLCVTIYW
eukprot:COSAG06_NODE_43846_length_368_cov_1.018587_1_plen_24_part_01